MKSRVGNLSQAIAKSVNIGSPASFKSVFSSVHASIKSERTRFLCFGLYIRVRTVKTKGKDDGGASAHTSRFSS